MKKLFNSFVATMISLAFLQTSTLAQSIVDVASVQAEASALEQRASGSQNADAVSGFRATTARVVQLAGEADALSRLTETRKTEMDRLYNEYIARTSGADSDAIIAAQPLADTMIKAAMDYSPAVTDQKKAEDSLSTEYKLWQEQRAAIRSTLMKEEGILDRAKRVANESREHDPKTNEKLKRILKHGDSVGGSVAVEDVSTSGKG